MALEKIERHQLSNQVADRLRDLIVSGEYPLGHRLPPEPQLMSEMGVGRSTVREAVQALAHAGILEVRQGSGTFVRAQPSETEPLALILRRAQITEVQEARRVIEIEIASWAALRRDAADLQAMREALDRREQRGQAIFSPAAFVEADLAFHTAIAQACGNSVLEGLYRSFAQVIREPLIQMVVEQGVDQAQAALHESLFQAIQDGDAEGARRTVAALLDRIVTSFDLT